MPEPAKYKIIVERNDAHFLTIICYGHEALRTTLYPVAAFEKEIEASGSIVTVEGQGA